MKLGVTQTPQVPGTAMPMVELGKPILVSLAIAVLVIVGGGITTLSISISTILLIVACFFQVNSRLLVDRFVFGAVIGIFGLVSLSYVLTLLTGVRAATIESASIFCLGVIVFSQTVTMSDRSVRMLMTCITCLVIFELLYGLFAYLTQQQSVFGIIDRTSLRYVTGTFGSKNLFAAFVAITAPACVGFILSSSLSKPIRWAIVSVFSMLCGIAVATSSSRLGFLALAIGLVVFMFILRRQGRQLAALRSKTPLVNWSLTVLAILMFISAVLWFGSEMILERFLTTTPATARLELWRATLDFSASQWFLGVGPGLFEGAYQRVAPGEIAAHVHYLHNDLLQFLLDHGLIIGIPCLVLGAVILRKTVFKMVEPADVGVIASLCAVAVVAFGDFPLHLPGLNLIFFCLLGLLVRGGSTSLVSAVDFGAVTKNELTTKLPSTSIPDAP